MNDAMDLDEDEDEMDEDAEKIIQGIEFDLQGGKGGGMGQKEVK